MRMRIRSILLFTAIIPATLFAQGYSPDASLERMTTAEGLKVSLFASEPEIRQPILVKCDDRGRVWTIQYLQYPNPAGLKRVKVDRWSRTVYDRIPEPPPRGPKGADKITICEDSDDDGRADKFTDFVTGLNLCTGLAFGHGGVFVLQVPYLLFYPDQNRDDVPDGDPKICLEGFGMEDAQALANHLTWGPDGWLYGVNGSTTTCRIRGVEFQQGCWRYHPERDEFELFCEGGQNTFGLTFDQEGELYYSTNGGPFVHAAQGAYFYKTFGKHGPLHHPFAYHHFPALSVDKVPGGPPTGGTIYLANGLSPQLKGTFIAGNFLGHTVSWWNVHPKGATVEATYGGVLLDAHDTWFGATDLAIGPRGRLYISDFYDARTAHPDPDANWDRSNGRIYSIHSISEDHNSRWTSLSDKTKDELLELLVNENGVRAEQARMEIVRRSDPTVIPQLENHARQNNDVRRSLQGLWTLHGMRALNESLMLELLQHPDPSVRRWIIRLAGDMKQLGLRMAEEVERTASTELNPTVLCQLAASAKRWPADISIPILATLMRNSAQHEEERTDWMIWWALESKAVSHRSMVISLFINHQWENPCFDRQRFRLIRRYASEGSKEGCDSVMALLDGLPENARPHVYDSLAAGLSERGKQQEAITQGDLFTQQANVVRETQTSIITTDVMTDELRNWIASQTKSNPDHPSIVEGALRAGVQEADSELLYQLRKHHEPAPEWLRLVPLLESGKRKEYLLERLERSESKSAIDIVRLLANEDDPEVGQRLLTKLRSPSTPAAVKLEIRHAQWRHREWATSLLQAVDRGEIDPASIPTEELRHVAVHEDAALNALVRKYWGNVGVGTPEEKLAVMRRFSNDLRAGTGDHERGRHLFVKHCGTCHKMKGEGGGIAPDLTTANRHDRAALLANVVDPSAVIRREFLRYVIETDNGQIVAGLLADQDPASVTLVDERNQRTRISRDQIASMTESNTSLMPERILENLTPQERRDLFAYLEQP